MRTDRDVVRVLANDICEQMCRKVIHYIQNMTYAGLSGDDSGLKNTWDEICVQLQFERSDYWDVYDHTVIQYTKLLPGSLKEHEKFAIWLQSWEGSGWRGEDEPEDEEPLIYDDELATHIANEYVYSEAINWSNSRITAYLENCYG